MEIVFSFDDTGSMYSCRQQVRREIEQLVNKLFSLNSEMRIGIIIHNDYCDRDTIQLLDLTADKDKIIGFINRGSSCGGGDSDECYELVINNFHSKFSWKTDKRVAVLIGDCEPHRKGYTYGGIKVEIDWKEEIKKCSENGIRIYPIQALGRGGTFYTTIASMCNTPRLELSQFSHINQYLTAISYSEEGKLEEYENSQPEFKTNTMLRNMFNKLKGLAEVKSSGGETTELASRFQVMDVGPVKKIIKNFVEENGATFKKGRGFYQFVLTETIQESKEVLFQDKLTGEVKSDTAWCREQLGVPLGTRGRVNPREVDCTKQYDVFIQSTSYNRKLDPNTKFLYELEHR